MPRVVWAMNWDKMTIHCSTSSNGKYVPRGTIEQWHISRGFTEIGYHFLIEPNGEIINGRSLDKQGAHVEGANVGNIGICLIGNNQFTLNQFNSLKMLIDQLTEKYSIKPWSINTHNQFTSAIKQGKTCPNISINKLLTWYLLGNNESIKSNLLEVST